MSIDGLAYTDKETVNRLMSEKRWGDAVVYKVLRDGAGADAHRPPAAPAPTKAPASPLPGRLAAGAEMPKMPPAGMPGPPTGMPPKPPSGGGQ